MRSYDDENNFQKTRNDFFDPLDDSSEEELDMEDYQRDLQYKPHVCTNPTLESFKRNAEAELVRTIQSNTEAVKALYEEEMSDSEDALEPFTETKQASSQKRRESHKSDLEAIAAQAFPSDRAMHVLYKKTRDKRSQEHETQGIYVNYSRETIELFEAIGKHVKKTNMMHNSFLLKAFLGTVSEGKALASDSHKYNKTQGDIRTKLLDVIQKSFTQMQWAREDFKDENIWRVVEYLSTHKLSGDSERTPISELIDSQQNIGDAVTFTAFHHIAFKAARDQDGNKFVERFALRPDNLSALHDKRERKDGAVPPEKFGDHEWAHRVTGFTAKDDHFEWVDGEKDNHFSRIDTQAAKHVIKQLAVPRTTKREKYALNMEERMRNFIINNRGADSVIARRLYDSFCEQGDRMETPQFNEYMRENLESYKWGRKLLNQQDAMDERTRQARDQASGRNLRNNRPEINLLSRPISRG